MCSGVMGSQVWVQGRRRHLLGGREEPNTLDLSLGGYTSDGQGRVLGAELASAQPTVLLLRPPCSCLS